MRLEAAESLAQVTAAVTASAAIESGLRAKRAGPTWGVTVAIALDQVEGVRNSAQATLLAALTSSDDLDVEEPDDVEDMDLIQWSGAQQNETIFDDASEEDEKL